MEQDSFSKLGTDQKILFVGNTLVVLGAAICSFGQLFRLMKLGELPTQPTTVTDHHQTDFKPQQNNYTGRPRTTGFFQS